MEESSSNIGSCWLLVGSGFSLCPFGGSFAKLAAKLPSESGNSACENGGESCGWFLAVESVDDCCNRAQYRNHAKRQDSNKGTAIMATHSQVLIVEPSELLLVTGDRSPQPDRP